VAPPIVEGGMAIILRPFKLAADQAIEPRLLHGQLVDLNARKRERAVEVMRLAEAGQLTDAMRICVEDRLNILISGGTSTGKTTFARSLLAMVDQGERLVTIEDAYKLFPGQKNVVALKADRNAQVNEHRRGS
jgi:type IV secretion system protein VirB11